ncbi:unnamed protein product, partial [marine sediment metagenome]
MNCPECNSTDVHRSTQNHYDCYDCGFVGPISVSRYLREPLRKGTRILDLDGRELEVVDLTIQVGCNTPSLVSAFLVQRDSYQYKPVCHTLEDIEERFQAGWRVLSPLSYHINIIAKYFNDRPEPIKWEQALCRSMRTIPDYIERIIYARGRTNWSLKRTKQYVVDRF